MKPRKFDALKLQSYLKSIASYDPIAGVFTAINSTGNVKAGSVRGSVYPNGYARFYVAGHTYLVHVLVWVYMTGTAPAGEIDHLDGDRGNNKWRNLRDVTSSTNCHNQPLRQFAGVTKKVAIYRARCTVDGERKHLGYFKTKEEAHQAYMKEKTIMMKGAEARYEK